MGNEGPRPILSVREISKEYSGVEVLRDISLDFYPGEVHALLGENGAGKSTLSKIISGVTQKSSGYMEKNGKPYNPLDTKDANEMGISIVHQEFNLIDVLSIAQNIYLGREKMRWNFFINEGEILQKAKSMLELVDLDIPAGRQVKHLSVAQQQLVEIAKCLSYNSEIIIMDEPTAALTINETKQLFEIIESLRAQGVAIIYISHKLDEIFHLSQKVTVLRDGDMVGTFQTKDLDEDKVVNLMVGREISSLYQHEDCSTEEIVLEVKNLTRVGKIDDISFKLRKGEILGFGGLVGSGRTDLMKMIFGEYPIDSGEIILFDEKVDKNSIERMVSKGLAYLPESRKEEGILSNMKVKHNITLSILDDMLEAGLISKRKERALCTRMIDAMGIKTHNMSMPVGQLSGGNQQKVVIAKWLSTDVRILILDEPTRGIDVGAKHEIYKLMDELCKEGISIIIISSEMPELIGMCDRVMVMSEGRISGELSGKEISETAIMSAAVQRGHKIKGGMKGCHQW